MRRLSVLRLSDVIRLLESAGKSLPLDWEPVADEPVIVGDQVTLRLPLSEQLRFYRLRRL